MRGEGGRERGRRSASMVFQRAEDVKDRRLAAEVQGLETANSKVQG